MNWFQCGHSSCMSTNTLYFTCDLTNRITHFCIGCFQLTNIHSICIIRTRCHTFNLIVPIIEAILSQGYRTCIRVIRICTTRCNCYAITICYSCVTSCIFKCSRFHICQLWIYGIANCFTCMANHHIIACFESKRFIWSNFFWCCTWCAVDTRTFSTNGSIPACISYSRLNLIFSGCAARSNVVRVPRFISQTCYNTIFTIYCNRIIATCSNNAIFAIDTYCTNSSFTILTIKSNLIRYFHRTINTINSNSICTITSFNSSICTINRYSITIFTSFDSTICTIYSNSFSWISGPQSNLIIQLVIVNDMTISSSSFSQHYIACSIIGAFTTISS